MLRRVDRSLADLPAETTERLRLAPLRQADAAELHAVTNDPTILGSIDFLSARFTREDAAALIRRSSARECFFGIRLRQGGGLIGVIGAHLRGAGDLEIGYWIGSAHRGRGFATEAATGLAAALRRAFPRRRIIAECRAENHASWRVLEKAGFFPTGAQGIRPGRDLLVLRR